MSILNVTLMGSTALVAVDTQAEMHDGRVEEHSKLCVIPHTNLVFAGRGLIDVMRRAFWNCLHVAPTFERAAALLPELLPKVMTMIEVEAEAAGVVPKHWIRDYREQDIFVVGNGRRGMSAMYFNGQKDGSFSSRLLENDSSCMGPEIGLEPDEPAPRTVDEMMSVANRQVEASAAKGMKSVGGAVLIAELSQQGLVLRRHPLRATA